MASPTNDKNIIDGIQYPGFRGSEGQCRWARNLRFQVFTKNLYAKPEDLELLKKIVDATWWIGNEAALLAGAAFKQPAESQLLSTEHPLAELNLGDRYEVMAENLVKFNVTSAQSFAQEVAMYPRLAEIALLVMMAKATTNVSLKVGLKSAIREKIFMYEVGVKDEVKRNSATIQTLFEQL